jgi:glycosyltransferase involved in cell wall biosynthesis
MSSILSASPSAYPTSEISRRDVLICFSHLRWDFVYQRPQHLLTRAADDYSVFYMEEPVFSDVATPSLQLEPRSEGVVVVRPLLPHGSSEVAVIEMQRELLNNLLADNLGDEESLTLWYYTPMALRFSSHLEARLCVYDCMDELSAFRFAPTVLKDLERLLFERADVVFTGGRSLYEAKRHHHSCVHAFPSSVDCEHFARARSALIEPAQDQQAIAGPRVGFFGVIDERMDLELVGELAQRCQDIQFVLIGPVVKIDPSALPQAPNLHWLGGRRYQELPQYLAGWNAGFMPFALNESTRFISPTKTPEFLAAGVPVCSTPIVDVVRPYGESGLVEVAANAQEFEQRLRHLLNLDRETWLARVDEFLGRSSWDQTWAEMHDVMQKARAVPALHGIARSATSESAYV